ncbi:hypothetical protein Tco_1358055, partial [Tanacetum coccineum]
MVAAMKHMVANFSKRDKFKGVNFRRWQKKVHFLLSTMSMVYVLTIPKPEDGENAIVEQSKKGANGIMMTMYVIASFSMDASSKKFLVSNFTNYKMTDSRLVMEQYNELLGILGRFTQHKMNMDEAIQVSCSHLHIEESLRVQDSDKPKGNNVVGPLVVNMVEHNNSTRDCKGVNVGSKANCSCKSGSGNGSVTLKGHNMFNKSLHVCYVTYVSESNYVQDNDVAWWI